MKVTVLGCGASLGVPIVGNDWGNCDPSNPKNRRMRASIFIEEKDQKILIDTSPDLREQLLAYDIREVTAVLYTHAHSDHLMGLPDLRVLNWLMQKQIPIYGNKTTIDEIRAIFSYVFERPSCSRYFKEIGLVPNIIENDGVFDDLGLSVQSSRYTHGLIESLGYRFGDFAYSTDISAMKEWDLDRLAGVKVWVVSCASLTSTKGHAGLEEVLSWIDCVKPERAYLTHMNNTLDYDTLCTELPDHIRPAYDGLVIEI